VLTLKMRDAEAHPVEADVHEPPPLHDLQSRQIDAISLEIVERIQILGGVHIDGSEKSINSARLGGDLTVAAGRLSVLAEHEAMIRLLREDAQKCSEVFDDQGTFAMLVNVLRTHEKMAWILRSNIAMDQPG
jgi:starvation-inducible DNA-binding protein